MTIGKLSKRTAWLLEGRARVDLGIDPGDPVRSFSLGDPADYGWYVAAYCDGEHRLYRVDMHAMQFVPELAHTDEYCAGCGAELGEGAEYEPSDSIYFEHGSVRGEHLLEPQWTGCDYCVALRRREIEEAA